MAPNESVAEVFLIALKSMTKEQKNSVLQKIVCDKEFNQDLQDLLLIRERKDEGSRPFREFLAEK